MTHTIKALRFVVIALFFMGYTLVGYAMLDRGDPLTAVQKVEILESKPVEFWDFFRARNQKERKVNISNLNDPWNEINIPDLYEKTNRVALRYSKVPLSKQQICIGGCAGGVLGGCCAYTALSLMDSAIPDNSKIPLLITSLLVSTSAAVWYMWKYGYRLKEHKVEDYQSVRLPNLKLYQKVNDEGGIDFFYREYVDKKWILTKVPPKWKPD